MRRLRVALTGGIGTGKSYSVSRFAMLGVPVIDADSIVREVQAPGTAGLTAIVNRFGRSVLKADGALDRALLARQVFEDPAARRDLEAIVHPLVYRRIDAWFDGLSPEGFAMADVPLLYETGRESTFDRVVAVACPPAQQVERLLARGLSTEEALRRIAAQLPIEEKARRADYVIDTSGTEAGTDRQILEVWERLRADQFLIPNA